MLAEPAIIYVDNHDLDLYDKLPEDILNFNKRDRKDQFLFALAVGFKFGAKSKLNKKKDFFRSSYLLPKDENLLRSVAWFETKDTEVLNNWIKIFEIAEMYAHGGIKLLYENVKNTPYGKFEKKIEEEIIEKLGDIKKSKNKNE
jgi:hypothetical protein